jgi:hypothetical protein
MFKIAIKPASFCYGPTSIALAVANEFLAKCKDTSIVGIGDSVSLDQMYSTASPFYNVINTAIDTGYIKSLSNVDAVLSICDFEFAKSFIKMHPNIPLVFIDPLFWMWDSIPPIVGKCARYLALDIPGVQNKIEMCEENNLFMIPQIAEVRTHNSPHDIKSRRIIFYLGGLISPLGANMKLAAAMCEDLIWAVERSDSFDFLDIRTSIQATAELNAMIRYNQNATISFADQTTFQAEVASSDLLITVPGMSIVFECLISPMPTLFVLPLNYSQHLQMIFYRDMFNNIHEVGWKHLGRNNLPFGLPEEDAVPLAFQMGDEFHDNLHMRNLFRNLLFKEIESNILPLESLIPIDTSGAAKVFTEVRNLCFPSHREGN